MTSPSSAPRLPSGFETPLHLDQALIDALRKRLPDVARHTVEAIIAEVPAYRRPFDGPMGDTIQGAVQAALAGFLRLAGSGRSNDPSRPLGRATAGAFELGKTEAKAGRSADALLAAYRIGARVAWRELSGAAVAAGAPADAMASFAELVFAYIDQLSASSVQGHASEVSSGQRAQQRHQERLAGALLRGEPLESVLPLAERAGWRPSRTLTAVIVPESQAGTVLTGLGAGVLQVAEELPGIEADDARVVLLVPDAGGGARARLLVAVANRGASVGPARPWHDVHTSYRRAVRALDWAGHHGQSSAIDTEVLLPELVLNADPAALADLRERALAPLAGLREGVRDKLEETLRAWILHQGRREDVAAALFVHPQTVRYRMGQLRELFGGGLEDPQLLFELTLALGRPRA